MSLLIGGNSATQGYTDRCRQAAEVFGPGVMVWLSSAGPQDAIRYPHCVHFLRLENWSKGESSQSYVQRQTARIQSWRVVPNLILIPGNEPDIESNHSGEDIQQYAYALRAAFPGVKIANVPLSTENTPSATYTGCDVRVCHSYFERQHPEDALNPQFGGSYLNTLDSANGMPVYVTEFNVVQTNSGVDWTDRNAQAAHWLDEAEKRGVAGVAFFILDAAPDWASFDVGPEAAADILAKRGTAQPPAPPPPIVLTGYSGNSRPKNGVTTVNANWENHAPADVIAAYAKYAPQIGYDPNLALGQSADETGWWTSPAYRLHRNMAGIGITGDNVIGPTWETNEQGVQAHLALLNCYYGNGTDPWGQLTAVGFGGFTLGKQVLNDMDGVWAVPGATYGDTIAANANLVSGETPPVPQPPPTPKPVPSPVLIPLSRVRDIAAQHIGKTITDEGAPEFGMCEQEFEECCEEAGLPRTRYATAAANGDVLMQRGVLSLVMPPPVGSGLVLGRAFDPNGHICCTDEYPYVITTYPGSVSRIDAKAAGWYDSVGLLGWFVPEGAAIDGIEEVDMHVDGDFDDGRLARLWDGSKTPTQVKSVGGYDGNRGIDARWAAELKAGRPLGFATSNEESIPTGGVIRYFSNGFICWYPDGTTTVC